MQVAIVLDQESVADILVIWEVGHGKGRNNAVREADVADPADTGKYTSPQQGNGLKLPRIPSRLSVDNVESQLSVGMPIKDAVALFDTFPIVSSLRATYILRDGSITLMSSNVKLSTWTARKN